MKETYTNIFFINVKISLARVRIKMLLFLLADLNYDITITKTWIKQCDVAYPRERNSKGSGSRDRLECSEKHQFPNRGWRWSLTSKLAIDGPMEAGWKQLYLFIFPVQKIPITCIHCNSCYKWYYIVQNLLLYSQRCLKYIHH